MAVYNCREQGNCTHCTSLVSTWRFWITWLFSNILQVFFFFFFFLISPAIYFLLVQVAKFLKEREASLVRNSLFSNRSKQCKMYCFHLIEYPGGQRMCDISTKQNVLDLYLALQSLCKCVYLLPHCSLHLFCPLMSLDHHQGCGWFALDE